MTSCVNFFSDFVIFPTQKLRMVFENALHLIIWCPWIDRQQIWINFKIVICPQNPTIKWQNSLFDDFKHLTNLKKSIFSNLRLAMSSLWWKMCFTKLIQIPWFIFRLSEEMSCSVSPDWKVWVARHACTCASFWSSIT